MAPVLVFTHRRALWSSQSSVFHSYNRFDFHNSFSFLLFCSFPEGFHASTRGCKVREDRGRQLAAAEKSLSWCCREGNTCRHNKTCVWDQSTVKLSLFHTCTMCVFMLSPLLTSLLYVYLTLDVCVCSERTNSTACGRTLWQPEGGAALTQPGRFTTCCCEGKRIKKFFDALIHWNISLSLALGESRLTQFQSTT